MDESELIVKAQELTDLELALLISLVAGQHCIIQAEEESLDPLQQELQLIASNVFGLSHAVVQCSESTTLEEFSNGILVNKEDYQEPKATDNTDDIEPVQTHPSNTPNPTFQPHRPSPSTKIENHQDDLTIAGIVILKDLNQSDEQVQIQALELLRTKRIFTHTAFYSASKSFLIVILKSTSGPRLVKHLNDHIFISHYHDPTDGFANLQDSPSWIEENSSASSDHGSLSSHPSLSSIIHHHHHTPQAQDPSNPSSNPKPTSSPLFTQEAITTITTLSTHVTIPAEIKTYLQNIVTFLRMHRAVDSGISPRATRHFDLLVTILPPLHSLPHATPPLVALAARKIYAHRIICIDAADADNERSMQYGSDVEAVRELLVGVTPEGVIEEVLGRVGTPL